MILPFINHTQKSECAQSTVDIFRTLEEVQGLINFHVCLQIHSIQTSYTCP